MPLTHSECLSLSRRFNAYGSGADAGKKDMFVASIMAEWLRMADDEATRIPAALALRGRLLAARKLNYLLELQRSGRFSMFYSEPDFQIELEKAKQNFKDWETLVRSCGVVDPSESNG